MHAGRVNEDRVDEDAVSALAAYLRALPPPPAPMTTTATTTAMASEAAERGRIAFHEAGCTDCHVPPLFTAPDTFEVAPRDEAGADEFNPPSLRGVAHRRRLFHDGRYGDIEDVLALAEHPGTESLDAGRITDVVAFLRTL